MQTIFKDEAIVLRKSPVGSFDLSITVYTKQIGKENIYIPKGQLLKSSIITASEPFNWFKGVFKLIKGKLYLQEIETFQNLAIPISQNLDRFETAFSINKIFHKYVIFPDEKFFILLKKTLYYLSTTDKPEMIKLNFLAKFILLSGIYPELERCQICKTKIRNSNLGTISVEKAGTICTNCTIKKEYSKEIYPYIKSLKNINFQSLNRLNIPKKQKQQTEKFFYEYINYNV